MSNSFIVKNPATGEALAIIERDSEEVILQKIATGNDAFQTWKKTNAHERSKLLSKWSTLIQEHKASIAEVMTKENGKPLAESLGEVDYATSYMVWYAEEAKRLYGRTRPCHANRKE